MKTLLVIVGLGGNMAKNPLKDLLIQGATTDAAPPKVVQPRSRWSYAEQMRPFSSSHTLLLIIIQTPLSPKNPNPKSPMINMIFQIPNQRANQLIKRTKKTTNP